MSDRLAPQRLNPAWSLMRCVFALEICLVHLSSPIFNGLHDGWLAETVFLALSRTGTIGFIMLAGAILIGRGPGNIGQYLSDRLRRWLPLLLGAQLAYLALAMWIDGQDPRTLAWSDLLEPSWYHMWFFYALGPVYLVVVPMRWYAARAAALGDTARLIALWSPVAGLFAGIAWITAEFGLWGDLRPVNILIYCGYAWTGHAIAATFPRGARGGGLLLLAGIALATLVTVLAVEAADEPVKAYFHRCSIFVALAGAGQFLLLLRLGHAGWSPPTTARVHAIARLTLGIFVVHPFLIVLAAWPPAWAVEGLHKWLTLPAAALLLFAASGAVTWAWLRAGTAMQRALAGPRPLRPS